MPLSSVATVGIDGARMQPTAVNPIDQIPGDRQRIEAFRRKRKNLEENEGLKKAM
jgi:hypothetical protein